MTRSEKIKLAKHGIAVELGLIEFEFTARWISENEHPLEIEEIEELELEMRKQAQNMAEKLNIHNQ